MTPQEKSILYNQYQSFRNKENAKLRKKSAWYRLVFPNYADYSVHRNPYAYESSESLYNPANGYVDSIHNRYRDHHQD